MKTNNPPIVTDTPKGDKSIVGNNPKKPGNDPDQTPEKETQDQPKSKKTTEQKPAKDSKQKAGFKYKNANN